MDRTVRVTDGFFFRRARVDTVTNRISFTRFRSKFGFTKTRSDSGARKKPAGRPAYSLTINAIAFCGGDAIFYTDVVASTSLDRVLKRYGSPTRI